MNYRIIVILLVGLSLTTSGADKGDSKSRDAKKRMEWFMDAKFGLFLVWGLYSIPEGMTPQGKALKGYAEWYQMKTLSSSATYAKLASQFNPEKFDADAIVVKAKSAGMRYITITAKFHDGFAMWPSKHSDFNISLTPFYKNNPSRDLLLELRTACDKHGIKLIFYYSQVKDWHQYDAWHGRHASNTKMLFPNINRKQNHENYISKVLLPQLEELTGKYRADGFWFDTPAQWSNSREIAERVVKTVRSINPECLINSRLIHKQTNASSYWDLVDYAVLGDGATGSFVGLPWYGESPAVGQLGTYGYHSARKWHKPKQIIGKLIHATCNNYNYLLTIGQRASGEFPEGGEKILKSAAKWMKINQEAIHGTRGIPPKIIRNQGKAKLSMCSKGNLIYLFLNKSKHINLHWEAADLNQLKNVRHLIDGKKIPFKTSGTEIQFEAKLAKERGYEVLVLEFHKKIQ